MDKKKNNFQAGFKVAPLLLLLWASHQTEWRSEQLGSWMKDGLFRGWKLVSRGSVHIQITWVYFSVDGNTISVLYTSTYSQEGFQMVQAQHFLLSKRTLWRIYVIVLGCLSLCLLCLFLPSFLCPSCPISLLLLWVFSLSLHPSIHPYVVGFATFIENH